MANNFSQCDNSALWRFEDGSLGIDSKGNNNLTAAPQGAPISDTSSYVEGEGSAYFHTDIAAAGVGYYIDDVDLDVGFPLKSGDTNKKISICFWYKPNLFGLATGFRRYLVTKGATGKWSFIIDAYRNSGADESNIRLQISTDGSTHDFTYEHATPLNLNKWYHIAVTYEPGAYRIRIWDNDAEAILGSDLTGVAATVNVEDSNWKFSWAGVGYASLCGNLDECVVYNKVLSVADIDKIRSGTFSCAGPEKAVLPNPITESIDVSLGQATIAWVDGGLGESNEATSFNVYFGTTAGSLTLVSEDQEAGETTNQFSLVGINNGTPFGYTESRYWRIDSIFNGKTTAGDVWVFTTRPIVFNIPPFPPVRPTPDIPDPWWIVPPPYPVDPGPYVPPYWGPDPIYKAAGGGRWNQQLVVAGNKKVYYEAL